MASCLRSTTRVLTHACFSPTTRCSASTALREMEHSLAAELLLVVLRMFTRFSSDLVMPGLSATTGDDAREHTDTDVATEPAMLCACASAASRASWATRALGLGRVSLAAYGFAPALALRGFLGHTPQVVRDKMKTYIP